jgi:hypothetical protein
MYREHIVESTARQFQLNIWIDQIERAILEIDQCGYGVKRRRNKVEITNSKYGCIDVDITNVRLTIHSLRPDRVLKNEDAVNFLDNLILR